MRIQVTACDKCGAVPANELYKAVGRKADPAGSMETINDSIELCFDCMTTFLQSVLIALPAETIQNDFKRLRSDKVRRAVEQNHFSLDLKLSRT